MVLKTVDVTVKDGVNPKIHYYIVLSVFILGFLVSLFPVRMGVHDWDETVYLQHAEIWAGLRADTYNEFDFRPPLLPFLISVSYKIFPSLVTAHTIVAFISAFGIILVFMFGVLLFNEKVGFVASVVYGFLPLQVFMSHSILVDSMLPSFWLLTAMFFYLGLVRRSTGFYCLSGVSLGLSALLKFTSLALVPALFAIYFIYRFDELKRLKLREFFNYQLVVLLVSFAVVLSPYLLLNYETFGSFFHTLSRGAVIIDWASPSDPSVFLGELPLLLPPHILLGFIFAIYLMRKVYMRTQALLLLSLVLIPSILFFGLHQVNVRYFLAVAPFLALLCAHGILGSFDVSKWSKVGAGLCGFSIILFLFVSLISPPDFVVSGFHQGLFPFDESLVMQASLWLRDNTLPNAVVYSNEEWPVIAYYSQRKLVLLPVVKDNFQDEIGDYVSDGGYVVVSSAWSKEPRPEFLLSNNKFTLMKEFNSSNEKIQIFKYAN